ncbi:MAG: undecaprenyl-diphosphate phosphatase [Actinomycetota bacterium]
MDLIQAVILGIIEGGTEFLPVSSTGHMILASAVMDIQDVDYVKTFEVSIQIGAILSVLTLYYKRFLVSFEIYLKLLIAFLPTGTIGFIAYSTIKEYLFNAWVVSVALVLGGVLLIMLDRWSEREETAYATTEKISYRGCLQIGLFQSVSMIPGVSRAAATIFGGVFSGFTRKQAAEFSFLLAIPTMAVATGYDLFKTSKAFSGNEWTLLAVGAAVAFVFALLAVKAFIAYLTRHGFKLFGYYRIALGIVFLTYALATGLELPE